MEESQKNKMFLITFENKSHGSEFKKEKKKLKAFFINHPSQLDNQCYQFLDYPARENRCIYKQKQTDIFSPIAFISVFESELFIYTNMKNYYCFHKEQRWGHFDTNMSTVIFLRSYPTLVLTSRL